MILVSDKAYITTNIRIRGKSVIAKTYRGFDVVEIKVN